MTDKEIRIIKKYYTRPVTAVAYLLAGILPMLLWIVLDMMRSVVFHLSGTNEMMVYVGLTLFLLYMVFFLFQAISVIWGVRRKKWAAIQDKARTQISYTDRSAQLLAASAMGAAGRLMSRSDRDEVKAAGDISTAVGGLLGLHAIVSILFEVRRSARLLANTLGVRLPSVKLRVTAIILIPVAALLSVAVPSFAQAVRESREDAAQAAVVVGELEAAFAPFCDRVYADDPVEYYRDYGYQVTGNLYDDDLDTRAYLSVTVNNDALVEKVVYSLEIDIHASKEDNIARAAADLERLNQALRSADVSFLAPNLGEVHTLREDFVARFQENSYYENCRADYEEDGLFIGYYTESQEGYDDYSTSYFYITVEPPEEAR